MRDKPADLGLPDYVEEDTLSSEAETRSQERLHGLQPYLILLRNWRFGVDLAARKISGTASGLLDGHAYLDNGLQALIIGWISTPPAATERWCSCCWRPHVSSLRE